MKSYKLLISEYLLNEYSRIESDVKQVESEIRWGNYNSHDVAQLQLLKCKFECFKEFSNNILHLLNLGSDDVIDFYEKYIRGGLNNYEKKYK